MENPERDNDCIINEDNRKAIVEQIAGFLTDDNVKAQVATAYANRLLDESDNWSKYELEASVAGYLDGWEDGCKQKNADSKWPWNDRALVTDGMETEGGD